MRIFGYVLVAIGLIFLAMFVLAEFGGGHLSWTPFFISIVLVYFGWTMARSGTALVKPAPARAVPGTGGRAAASASVEGPSAALAPTQPVPMSPQVADVIRRVSGRSSRIVLYVAGGMAVVFIGIGVVLALLDKTPGEGVDFLAIFSCIGIGAALMIVAITWFSMRRPYARDLRSDHFYRTAGPIQVVPIAGGIILRLADRAFMVGGSAGMRELGGLRSGTVDYTPYGHMVLAAWNDAGTQVYCAPGYPGIL